MRRSTCRPVSILPLPCLCELPWPLPLLFQIMFDLIHAMPSAISNQLLEETSSSLVISTLPGIGFAKTLCLCTMISYGLPRR
jgi:hypothetical protein